jgi:hypothetical protein
MIGQSRMWIIFLLEGVFLRIRIYFIASLFMLCYMNWLCFWQSAISFTICHVDSQITVTPSKIYPKVITYYPCVNAWMQAFVQFITMQFQLCSVFFTFSLGTRTHYFGRAILHGGAKVCFL